MIMVSAVQLSNKLGAFGIVSTLISTLGLAVVAGPAFSQSFSQQRACIETNAGQVICGRLVDNNRDNNRYDNNRYDNNRYDNNRYDNRYDNNRYDNNDRDRLNSSTCNVSGFDEKFYREAYQDVEAAIRQGRVKTACEHYRTFGRYEGRFTRFNEASYLAKNPDVANAIRQKQFRSGYDHWQRFGRFENRSL
jgi:hypothetical protein